MTPRLIFRYINILPIFLLLVACSAGRSITTNNKTPHLDTALPASVCNQPYRFQMPRYAPPTILGLFQIKNTKADSVSLQFDDPKTLRITYQDSTTIQQKTFAGRITRKGFKIIFSNKREEMPPFIPILFARYDVNFIKLALTRDHNLVIKNIWNQGGRLLIFGSGDSGTRKSYFTILR